MKAALSNWHLACSPETFFTRLSVNGQLFLSVVHDRFDDAVYGIENALAGQVEIVGEDGKRDLLAPSS